MRFTEQSERGTKTGNNIGNLKVQTNAEKKIYWKRQHLFYIIVSYVSLASSVYKTKLESFHTLQ